MSSKQLRRRTQSRVEDRLLQKRRRYQRLFVDADLSVNSILGTSAMGLPRLRKPSAPPPSTPADRIVKLYAESLKDRPKEPREAVFKRIEGTVEKTLRKYYGKVPEESFIKRQ